MNTSYKCNCCCKEDVCKYKNEYNRDCRKIMDAIGNGSPVEVSIKCKLFLAHTSTLRGTENGNR